jgi:hypothetical protein
MTRERAQAYGRVMRTLAEIGSAKLLPAEQERIRAAADTLVLSSGRAADAGVGPALADVEVLVERLVDSERWTEERAAQLLDDVAACGPLAAATW